MQEIRDLGTIQFDSAHGKGYYKRLPCGLEEIGNKHSYAKQAAKWMRSQFIDLADKKVASKRILKDQLNSQLNDAPILEDIDQIYNGTAGKTERQSQVSTRVGQGHFRENLIRYWGMCSITGCKMVPILRASHIKPWRYATDAERLDMHNGLLLVPNADALFDAGLISVGNNGVILRSALLDHADCDLSTLGISLASKVRIEEQHEQYLEYHRTNIFLS